MRKAFIPHCDRSVSGPLP